MERGNAWYCILIYGVIHLLVDAASISFYFLLLRQATFTEPLVIFLLYAVFAFAMQAPLGCLADRLRHPVAVAALGCLLVAAGASLPGIPLLGLFLLGIGNALFHVGGGIITLSLSRNRATLPGVFVAPGTLGVAIGTAYGVANQHPAPLFAGGLVVAALVIFIFRHSRESEDQAENTSRQDSPLCGNNVYSLAILFLCMAIALRQIIGGFGADSMKDWLYAVPLAVFLGKSLGGVFADRFGWHRFTVTMILLSAPLLWLSEAIPFAGVVGLFLFSMPMPVTLAALAVLLPGHPGTAFGLASLALALGGFMALLILNDHLVLFLLTCLTAYLFHQGMIRYNQRDNLTPPFSEDQHEKSVP